MTTDSDLEMSASDSLVRSHEAPKRTNTTHTASLALFLLFLIVVVLLQLASGAYHSEFSAYPDEPAHYVTSLMLRDYLLHFHFESPIRFAEDYYYHYPKVAFGHWPPLFYILQSVWMIIFSASRASVRLEIAVTTALLGYAVFAEARRWFGLQYGVLAGLLTVALPLVQDYSDQEMSEALLTLLCFWSVVYFARYVESERTRDVTLFGVFFSLAVLTKGSGWLLALVPPIVLLLTRRWRLVTRPSFWVAPVLIGITCVPWQLMTMRLAERGWDGGTKPSMAYTGTALLQFLGLFPKILGPVFLLFLVFGIGVGIVKPLWRRAAVPAFKASLLALLIAVWVFHSVVPAGVEDRKLVIAVPAMILLLFEGGRWLADLVPPQNPMFVLRYALVAGLGSIAFVLTTFSIPKIQHYAFTDAAHFLTTHENLKDATILVSSESGGEGLLISEMAMDQPRPRCVIIRATKALADVAWNGVDYHSTYSSPAEISTYLKQQGIQIVVMDSYPPQIHFAHNGLLEAAVTGNSRCSLLATFPSKSVASSGEVRIYKLRR